MLFGLMAGGISVTAAHIGHISPGNRRQAMYVLTGRRGDRGRGAPCLFSEMFPIAPVLAALHLVPLASPLRFFGLEKRLLPTNRSGSAGIAGL
jgi:hypothetical protein